MQRQQGLLFRRPLIGRQIAGTAALEFGLLAPVFLIVLAGAVDIGSALYTRISLEAAIATGANYALVSATSVPGAGAILAANIATMMTSSNASTAASSKVVVNSGPFSVTMTAGAMSSSGTPTDADKCYCPTGSPTNWTWGSAVTCGNGCAGGGLAGKFVAVTASYSFTPYFSSYGFVKDGTISAGTMVQTQ